MSIARKENLPQIRQLELNKTQEFFDDVIRKYARPTEESSADNLFRTAQRAIDNKSVEFESILDEIRSKNFQILWRQDWFITDRFKMYSQEPHLFPDTQEYAELVRQGTTAVTANDMAKLRTVVAQLGSIRIYSGGSDELIASSNIIAG